MQKMQFENKLFYLFKAEIFSVAADWKVLACTLLKWLDVLDHVSSV